MSVFLLLERPGARGIRFRGLDGETVAWAERSEAQHCSATGAGLYLGGGRSCHIHYRHHSGFLMFRDMTVKHPAPGIVRQYGDGDA